MKIPILGSVSTLSLYLAFVIPSYAGERTIEAPLTADTRIMRLQEDGGGSPEPHGGDQRHGVYRGRDRTLLQFDLSGIPKGAKVLRATLLVTPNRHVGLNDRNQEMIICRVVKPWSEETATWNVASAGTPWDHPGGDAVGQTGVTIGRRCRSCPPASWGR